MLLFCFGKEIDMHHFIVGKKGFVLFVIVLLVASGLSISVKTIDSNTLQFNSNDDAGYRKDAGNNIDRSLVLYPGELIDDTPGRGRTGNVSINDLEDWYSFSVCQGQQIVVTVTPTFGYDLNLSLWTNADILMASSNNSGDVPETISYTATYTGYWFMQIKYVYGNETGHYFMDVSINGQNDANSGTDASNTLSGSMFIVPGYYCGYLDMNDPYDFYTFHVSAGQGIHLNLTMKSITYLTDFDLQLYTPNGTLVYEGNQCYADEFNYQADVSGEWSTRVDIFPGWVDVPHPTNWSYYSYGSGAYNLALAIEANGTAPQEPIPQPQITPLAKTFKVANDPTSTKDDFGYLAAIPACNYLDGGKRYLAPIIYTGDSTPTAYYDDPTAFGTVDDTTQYLVDDWNAYLDTYGKTPVQYTVLTDPIEAAADIATRNWASSQTAVVAVDGSRFNDTEKTVLKKTTLLRRKAVVEIIPCDSDKIVSIGGTYGYPMLLGPRWCAVNVSMLGASSAKPSVNAIFPLYIMMAQDWWPCPYDALGDKIDIYQPITRAGLWSAGTDLKGINWSLKITKYAGDRYRFKVTDPDSVINVKITTETPSDLLVFLVDPDGYLRAPDLPAWKGPVNPIHVWNGMNNPAVNPWRTWNPAPHTEFSAEVLHPEKGLWTAIVVPREANGSNVRYTITAKVRNVNPDRADATISAANAAVIASVNHLPLLYVTKTSVPAATQSAFSALGVNTVIFVESNGIGKDVRASLPPIQEDLMTMKDIVDEIKSSPASENYVTVTSLKTGDGFFAPAAMLAAYHGSPVIRVEDAPGNPAGVADRIETWRLWDGDYYHGGRSPGSLPKADQPVNITTLELFLQLIRFVLLNETSLPPFGLDADRYWNEEMYKGLNDYVTDLGLDRDGPEGYCFVAPRDDIYLVLHSTMMGNNSYAGDIPGITPAYSSAVVVRDLLYPALIFANPDKDITTSQLINYFDSNNWWYVVGTGYTSRVVKNIFQSHLRTFEGHCLWDAHLQRMNQGASVMYYTGHGTGGTGLSAQYLQTNYSRFPDQIWWDAWRGYYYDLWKTPRNNGMVWYNPEPPMLYDIIHYKWVDQQMQNLRSNAIFYAATFTGDGDGPLVYLDHGAVCWCGNAGTMNGDALEIQTEVFFEDVMNNGESIGPALSKYIWDFSRDYTTGDPVRLYNQKSLQSSSIPCIYGDPNVVIYSPEWTSPVPVDR
jgi:hypothetical protein